MPSARFFILDSRLPSPLARYFLGFLLVVASFLGGGISHADWVAKGWVSATGWNGTTTLLTPKETVVDWLDDISGFDGLPSHDVNTYSDDG